MGEDMVVEKDDFKLLLTSIIIISVFMYTLSQNKCLNVTSEIYFIK